MQNPQYVKSAADAVGELLPAQFFRAPAKTIGIILGTGISGTAKILDNGSFGVRIPFSSIPNFPLPSVKSHDGAFVFGLLNGTPVLAQLGRCHLYEGRKPEDVCMGVRVMATLGIKTLIITNAAGALNPDFEAGTLMCMSDMINHTGKSALAGINCDEWGERFPDMSQPFSAHLQSIAMEKALELGIPMERGVYIGVHGPEMETPAETRMYRQWGADAIGMSTVLEVAAARHMGLSVIGFSCLTNKNDLGSLKPVSLDEIISVAEKTGKLLMKLLPCLCAAI